MLYRAKHERTCSLAKDREADSNMFKTEVTGSKRAVDTVSPLYVLVPDPEIQPTVDRKH